MSFNTRSPAVKRLMKEAQELNEVTELFYAQPIEDNIFEWHFTIRGPPDTDFNGGIYHGRILLPAEYPMKPPSITFLTPNGRFKVNEKICLSISGHHPETWLPSWSIRTALLALIGFMPTLGEGALGSLDYTSDERKTLAKKSVTFKCSICNIDNATALPQITEKSKSIREEAKELATQIDFKNNKPQNAVNNEATITDKQPEINIDSDLRKRNLENNLDETLSKSQPPTPRISSSTSSSRISQTNSSNNRSMTTFILILLSFAFLFLFIRRMLILFNGELATL